VVLRWCTLAVGTSVIELTVYARGPLAGPREGEDEPGRAHVGIVVSGLDGLAGRLRAAGVRLRSDGPVPIAAGSYQGWRALYALDPDGTSVELFERPAGGKEAGDG
jgi:catechol 2,3-dioxygenase-like lactoylglutathione lyase family enzyme